MILELGLLFSLPGFALAAPAPQDEPSSFASTQPLVAAYYDPGPGARPGVDLPEMAKAGVEIALVAFGGETAPLAPLVAELDALKKDGRARPRLGPFLPRGRAADLAGAAAFLQAVPPRHWAQIDGRPVVWLGPAAPGETLGPAALEAAAAALGRRPYLVAEVSWKLAGADRTYAWGPLRGIALDLPVVSVSPGGSRRDDGRVYERAWYKALRLAPPVVAVESWNGPEDGISETPERKRKYLDLTQRFTRDFRNHERSTLPKGNWTAASQVAYTIVYNPHEQGLRPVPVDDGLIEEVRLRGFEALSSKENKRGTVRRICFDVDDSFCYYERRSFEVAFEYLDVGEGSFSLEYDSDDRKLPAEERVVKSAGVVSFTGSGEWRTRVLALPDAVFGNGQPGGSDFRFSVNKRGLALRSVLVMKK